MPVPVQRGGKVGVMMPANTTLVNYGIQNEKSDFRVHVSSTASAIYLFSTEEGNKAINTGIYLLRSVTTGSIITAQGYAVPISCIKNICYVKTPVDITKRQKIQSTDSTKVKGDKAVNIVKEMLILHLILLPMTVDEITDKNIQIEGTDIIVKRGDIKIQVKCDYKAGYPGTNNLFLQISECNPYKIH